MLASNMNPVYLAVCGPHHRAPGHQRQEPAIHRVRGRQQRTDPRQGALLRGGGGGLVEGLLHNVIFW